MHWRVSSYLQLKWRDWDGEYVIYNVAAGTTHQLDAFSAAVLRLLEGRSAEASAKASAKVSAKASEISAELESDYPDPSNGASVARVQAILNQLHRLDLVELIE